jgi:hypothetical protein
MAEQETTDLLDENKRLMVAVECVECKTGSWIPVDDNTTIIELKNYVCDECGKKENIIADVEASK